MDGVGCKRTTDDPDLPELEEADADEVVTCVVSVIALSMRTPRSLTDSAGWMSESDILTLPAGQCLRRRLQPSQISSVFDGLRRKVHPGLDMLNASDHPSNQIGSVFLSDVTVD